MEHIKECPRQIIPCSLSEFGCPWTGPRLELEATHIPQCPYEAIRGFLEISKTRMESLEQENKQLRGMFHDIRPQVQQLRDQVGELAESVQLMTQQEQQQAADGGSGGGYGGAVGMYGYMDSMYQHQGSRQPMLSRNDSYDMVLAGDGIVDNENEMRIMDRNNSLGAESMVSTGGGAAMDAQELLIAENERIKSEIETLTAGLASLELKQNMAIMTESMRMQEEVQSLRAVCHGLRMQMHYLLLEQQNRHHPPPGPPPPGSPASGNNKSGNNGGAGGQVGSAPGGGRPLSTSGPLRPRFAGKQKMIIFLWCVNLNRT